MLKSAIKLLYVDSERNQGVSKKTGNDYDMATLEVSDGIASVILPLEPNAQPSIQSTMRRGDSVVVTVDAKKVFGRHQLIVTDVALAAK